MPKAVYFDGLRLPASYANFYIANGLVLVPTFNDESDRVALNKLAELFPDRKVVGIACRDLVLGLGTLHCMTQQQRLGGRRAWERQRLSIPLSFAGKCYRAGPFAVFGGKPPFGRMAFPGKSPRTGIPV